ncbi:centrosomal protein of 126 kDa isoform X4 [Mustela lutreola]|uniref:centrosomal protein of 126 kDa isoform X4 n=1 Tax=Mustela lutreola TaxID=9666 RepID=UPI002796E944|nr:centrosomal protein of 126 kDa isoform X4 [Mustela lutreola]
MLAWRPGARSVGSGRGPASSDARDGAALSPRLGRGRCRPAADLDMKMHLEKNLEEERQILLQQQKICRIRARKYFVESNRRKKAFEEKRKEQEEKEQQIREQILQQRKEKFEEITEKFQRAYIPLSQRRRAVFQKRVPLLEEALKQIQESNLKSEVNLLPSYRPTINWRAIDNALPSALSKNDHKHQKHLLSKINCGKELKENNRANLTTNKDAFQLKLEETQKLLEDQHLSSLQIFCDEVNQLTNSETLSSIDSLVAGEHEEIYLTLEELCISSQKSSISPKPVNLQAANLSGGGEEELSFSKTQRINNWLVNVNDPKTETVPSVSDTLSKANVLPSCECLNGEDQSAPAERVTERADHSVASVYSHPAYRSDGKCTKVSETSAGRAADSCSGTFKRERPFVTESPTFKFSRVGTAADRLTREPATFADRGGACALAAESAAASCVPVATCTALPCGGPAARPSPESSRRRPLGPAQCSDKLGGLPEVREDTLQDVPRDKADPPLFSAGVPVAWVPPRSASDSGTHARAQTPAWGCSVAAKCDSVGPPRTGKHSAHERGGGVFLKSILKKESKCERGRFKALVVNHSGRCGGPRAALRDSAELAQEKATETAKTVKKLRWFDEPGDPAGQALKSRTEPCPQRGPSFRPQPRRGAACRGAARPQEDGISEMAAAPGAPAAAPVPFTCFVPSGCDAAKRALPTSGKGGRLPPRPRGGSKAETARPRGAGARRRTRSAPAQGTLSCALGRDAVPRPRSAGRAHGPWAAQGAPPVPPPPPRSTSCRSPWAFGGPATPHGDPQPVTAPGCLRASPVLPPERGGLGAWGPEGGGPLAHMPSGPGPTMPSPRGSRRRTRAEATGSGGSRARPARGDARRPPPLRAVPEESVPRRKAPSDARGRREADAGSPVVRRKQIVEDKQRSLLEQKRQNPASAGKKCGECTSNLEQSAQPSSSEPKHTTRCTSDVEEVSDSTSQFLMAENLVKASVPEDEILAVMNSRQLQKPHLAVNKTQPLNVCALLAAEQKLLQSLSHLNERFHYVQEAICKNPSIRNTLQIIPLLNSRSRGSLSPGVGSRLQRKY